MNAPQDAALDVQHDTVYLKDYQPPVFKVNTIDLTIQIFATETLVESKLVMQRQSAGDLVLLGHELELLQITLNGEALTAQDYELDDERLTLKNAPDACELITKVRIHPETNTQLDGLYLDQTADLFVTQNEPEGFRKITFFPDRPDVLTVYTTRLEADKKYPVLLANGNLIEKGDLADNRHYAIWHDPTYKPSYLFACVVGHLAVKKDTFTTGEGRKVALEIYADAQDIDKCDVAMQAVKDAMTWDEQHYGRYYDLDIYMLVSVNQFNAGAMENKGLNIFNTACVLSKPEVTTDSSNLYVKSTIAHEYFHNWTGNRITCRDWFQLCLKEGFTVFRDQSFAATLQSPFVQRIDDVSYLKSVQFAEDAGPMSHPPRPDHFIEINNFYTATVYDKGAEIIRMLANYLGPEKFRKGTDAYFNQHDGQAVTVEDLIQSLSDGSGVNLRNFLPWYSQPGTPVVSGEGHYLADTQTYTLRLRQATPKKPNYAEPQPLPIPVSMALFDRQNGALMLEQVILLDQAEQQFTFNDIKAEPIVSLLRDLSAPVLLDFKYSDEELAFLLKYETNGFNQWQAEQQLLERILLQGHRADIYLQSMLTTLPEVAATDPLLASNLLDIPSENYVASRIDKDYSPDVVHEQHEALLNALARELSDFWPKAYAAMPMVPYEDTSAAMGVRAWRNDVLAMAARAGIADALTWASNQYDKASCMSERLGALRVLVNHDALDAQAKLDDFATRFAKEDLAMDLWFSVQAGKTGATVAQARQLTQDARFDWGTPNRIRSVTGALAGHPTQVWTREGMQFYADMTEKMDSKISNLASRLLQNLSRWYTLQEPIRSEAKNILLALKPKVKSSAVVEALNNILKAGEPS